ncbi:MAG: hypothetical protein ACKOOH_06725 [Cyanobium sp.]
MKMLFSEFSDTAAQSIHGGGGPFVIVEGSYSVTSGVTKGDKGSWYFTYTYNVLNTNNDKIQLKSDTFTGSKKTVTDAYNDMLDGSFGGA